MSINMNEGRNKKLLVPVIALLLCATALIGAGYAAYVSSASNTGNEIKGDIITVSLKNGDKAEADAIADGIKISYGQIMVNNANTYYTAEETVVGYGTLSVDLSAYSGEKIKIIATTALEAFNDENSLNGQFKLGVRFTDPKLGNDPIVGTDYFEPTNTNGSKVSNYEFEVFATFTGNGTIKGDYETTINANKDGTGTITNPVLLDKDTKVADLINGFKYTVTFTVYPEVNNQDESGDGS